MWTIFFTTGFLEINTLLGEDHIYDVALLSRFTTSLQQVAIEQVMFVFSLFYVSFYCVTSQSLLCPFYNLYCIIVVRQWPFQCVNMLLFPTYFYRTTSLFHSRYTRGQFYQFLSSTFTILSTSITRMCILSLWYYNTTTPWQYLIPLQYWTVIL